MASQRNPEGQPSPTAGARVGTNRRVGGTVKRTGIPVGGGTRGKSVTMTGVGTEDKNPPESGRAGQDAANGTVHGQPRSGYNAGDNVSR
jgi:hypothetical protein